MKYIILCCGFLVAACGPARPRTTAEADEALGPDGALRYCELGRPLDVADPTRALFTRLTLRADGTAGLERVFTRLGRDALAFADQFAPGVPTAAWRDNPGLPRLALEPVAPLVALAERGYRPSTEAPVELRTLDEPRPALNPRRALRARLVQASGRRGTPTTFVPCASLGGGLTADLRPRPRWALDVLLATSELASRAPETPMPRGVLEGAAPADGRWCAVETEYDSFEPRRLRLVELSRGDARLTEYDRRGSRVRLAPPKLRAAVDEEARPWLIDLERAGHQDGWFLACGERATPEWRRSFPGVAF